MIPAESIATIQIDLDGVWAIRRCYGLEGGPEDADAIYAEGIDRFQEMLRELGVTATFFVVGMDTEVGWKAAKLKSLAEAGHELANHSYSHALDLSAKSGVALETEVALAHKRIFQTTGFHCRGFKAPGYALSAELLRVLDAKGYVYDASLFPTRWGWLLRGLTRWIGRGMSSPEQYGGGWGGPLRQAPFLAGELRGLVEMPVAVTPGLGLPFHGSVALSLGRRYFNSCLQRYVKLGLPLNYTLHGVDICDIGSQRLTGSRRGRFFFDQSLKKRLDFVKECLNRIQQNYTICSVVSAVDRLRPIIQRASRSE